MLKFIPTWGGGYDILPVLRIWQFWCLGGEHFADAVIKHLKHIYVEKLNRKIDKLIKRYNLQKERLIRDINFYNDLIFPDYMKITRLKKFVPRFKVNARFTYFTNGELIKILECIRGGKRMTMTENHYPLWYVQRKNRVCFSQWSSGVDDGNHRRQRPNGELHILHW